MLFYLKTLPSSIILGIPVIAIFLWSIDIEELNPQSLSSILSWKWLFILLIVSFIMNAFPVYMVQEIRKDNSVYEHRIEKVGGITKKSIKILYQEMPEKDKEGKGKIMFGLYGMLGPLGLLLLGSIAFLFGLLPGVIFMFILLAFLIIGAILYLLSAGITYIIILYLEKVQGQIVTST